MECWDYRHCPEQVRTTCPAHPDRGRDCWKITGTKCDSGRIEKASIGEKIAFCRTCDFYKEFANRY